MSSSQDVKNGALRLSRTQELVGTLANVSSNPPEVLKQGIQQLEGLLMRNGLLQTALYVAQKERGEPVAQAYRQMSAVMQQVWKEECAASSGAMKELFKDPLKKGDAKKEEASQVQLNPLKLAEVDRLTYQRLTRDALQVCELATGYLAALEVFGDATNTQGSSQGGR